MSDSETEYLRAAMKRIADGDWPRDRATIYRDDGRKSKHDQCQGHIELDGPTSERYACPDRRSS